MLLFGFCYLACQNLEIYWAIWNRKEFVPPGVLLLLVVEIKTSPIFALMQVDDALIAKLSRLAMLEFGEGEKEEIKQDLEKMIGFIDKLKELDTTGIEPLLHVSGEINVLRDDDAGNMITKEEALKNAPQHDGRYFQVPKVIQKPQ